MADSTSTASHAIDNRIDSIQNSHSLSLSSLSPNEQSVEMSELNPSKNSINDAGTSGLLNNISIPETSPITSDYPPYPSTFTSSLLPTTTTTDTKSTTATTITTTEMNHPSNPNKRLEDEASTSQERLTAPQNINDESSSTDPAPPPTMSKSEGKAPATANSSSSDPPESPKSRPRLDSDAIGSNLDTYRLQTPSTVDSGPTLVITLLLTSGAHHPYKIDEKYLTKRGVAIPGVTENGKKDPLTISVYTLKELILREWREEWEAKPSSPSGIRLIFFGKLLEDNSVLKDCKFKHDSSNVVHMTVRPQDLVDEEDASKAKSMSRSRDDGESTASCRCTIL
ncbi:hypothetical protein EYC80_001455 [Monilinia laxa]|uniref:Ubiquitin-like domain-containing protein n=1 Tax=Monilinia laxa TaxID=61186 RepID=A0A5N6K5S3_MONLA|nr:hypothetical protein EYC80_001455 [Monilinia laxa]